MIFQVQWLNCLWLMVPLLLWNFLLGPRLKDARITSDEHSSKWLLALENISRMAAFMLPLLIPLHLDSPIQKTGLILYLFGTLLYFASWLPLMLAPSSTWSNHSIGLFAPRITPLLPFIGIALIGRSWLYTIIVIAFILLHNLHGIDNLHADR